MFGQFAIDRALDRAAVKLGEGQQGFVFHLDLAGEVSASIIKRFGEHIEITGAVVLDVSDGFKFDKQHLSGEANLVARF